LGPRPGGDACALASDGSTASWCAVAGATGAAARGVTGALTGGAFGFATLTGAAATAGRCDVTGAGRFAAAGRPARCVAAPWPDPCDAGARRDWCCAACGLR
jgi:hypothetical protein